MQDIKNIYEGKYENYILPFFWQHGENEEILREYMKKIRESNIRAVCIESRPHPDFAGEKWWADMDIIIDEAKKLDMKVWVLDDSHFPTGYANGLVKEKYPERGKKVLKHKKIELTGPQKSIGIYTFDPMDKTAKIYAVIAVSGNKYVDLTDKVENDVVYFDVEDGLWNIYLIFESRQTDVNKDYINIIDRESVQVLIEAVYEPHYKRYKDDFGKTFVGFFSDEPGFSNEKGNKSDSAIGKNMPLPWNDEAEALIRERLGKEYKRYLPALWSDIGEETHKIRYIYMDIVTELYKKNFSEQLGNWCRERGVEYIGHIIEDRDSNARLGVGVGHMFRAMAGQDMAGVDVVINQIIPGIDSGTKSWFRGEWDGEFFHYALAKLGSSLGHIDPMKKGRTMAEVFGAYGWHEGVKLMKWLTDHMLVRGVNHFVPHAFTGKEFPDNDCPPHFYAHGNNPQFRYFGILMEYMNKMSNIFNGGKSKPTAAILYHAEAEWTGKYMLTQKPARVLTQNQIDFDIVPTDVFKNKDYFKTRVNENNYLEINEVEYKALIIPYGQYISKYIKNFIIEARNTKTEIIFIDKLPEGLYDSKEGIDGIDYVNVISLENLSEYMLEKGLYEIKVSTYEPYLRYYHYHKENLERIMLFNEDPHNIINTEIKINSQEHIYLFDVMENRISEIFKSEDGKIQITLEPYKSIVLLIGYIPEDIIDDKKINKDKLDREIILSNKWNVSIATAFEYPNFKERFELTELVNLALPKYLPKFSGHFKYSSDFDLEGNIGKGVIDLGDVFEVAELYINDKLVGTKIAPPYKFTLEEGILNEGKNKIDVIVTNTLDKQVFEILSTTEPIQPSGMLGDIKIRY